MDGWWVAGAWVVSGRVSGLGGCLRVGRLSPLGPLGSCRSVACLLAGTPWECCLSHSGLSTSVEKSFTRGATRLDAANQVSMERDLYCGRDV